MSKLSIILAATFLAIQVISYGHGNPASNVYSKQDGKGNYGFGYNVFDPKGASNYHQESGDAWGNKAGSYGLKDKDGRLRIVHYVADKNGFRVKIDSNEPGLQPKDSAHAQFNGPDPHSVHKVAHVTHQKPYAHHDNEHRYQHRQRESVIPGVPAIPSIPNVDHQSHYQTEKRTDEYVDIPVLGDILN